MNDSRYFKTDHSIPLDPLVSDYLELLLASGLARGRYTLARRHLVLFSAYLSGASPMSVNYSSASDFIIWLTENYRTYSAGYIANIIKSIRGFYKHLIHQKVVPTDPFLYVNLPRVDRMLPRDIPTNQQVRRLISAIPPRAQRDRAVIELLYGSGIRAAELLGLKLEDLHLEDKFMTITDSKSKIERNVPVNDMTAYALNGYLGGERNVLLTSSPCQDRPEEHRLLEPDFLFLKEGGFRLCRWRLSQIIENYRQKAGLPFRLTPHSFRHACAVGMLASGCPLRYIQALLGHQSVSTTMIYTRMSAEGLKQALDEVHPHGRIK